MCYSVAQRETTVPDFPEKPPARMATRFAVQAAHKVEMGVAAHDWDCMLPTKSRDPQVISRNRLPAPFSSSRMAA